MSDLTQSGGASVQQSTVASSGTTGFSPTPMAGQHISDEAWAAAKGKFIDNCIRNSPIAQTSDAWNHFNSVIDEFRSLIEAEL